MTQTLSSLDRRLLDAVPCEEPATATEIWRRFTHQPEGNLSLTTRMRRQRRETAARLEDLALDGHVMRLETERHGATVPTYWRESS